MRNVMLMALLFPLAFLTTSVASAAGIQIGKTRVIYEANKKEVALPIFNKEAENPWLVQSWVDTGDGKTRGPFIVTPPLFRLDAMKEQSLRIIWSGAALPQDRESLFYLNVRTIPAADKADKANNVLRLIYKTRLKLFFRPKGLEGGPGEACAKLQFNLSGKTLQVKNLSSYYVVFDALYLGNALIRNADMVAPKSVYTLEIPANTPGTNPSWRCINDYGSSSEKYSTQDVGVIKTDAP